MYDIFLLYLKSFDVTTSKENKQTNNENQPTYEDRIQDKRDTTRRPHSYLLRDNNKHAALWPEEHESDLCNQSTPSISSNGITSNMKGIINLMITYIRYSVSHTYAYLCSFILLL